MSKECKTCHVVQTLDKFISSCRYNETLNCVACRIHDRETRSTTPSHQARKKLKDNYKAQNPCAHCGESDPLRLQFDHIQPELKLNCISQIQSVSKLQEEITKCRILCAKCHVKHTMLQNQQRKKGERQSNPAYNASLAKLKKNKDYVNNLKISLGGCQNKDCDDVFDLNALPFYEFDHQDDQVKHAAISIMTKNSTSFTKIQEELEKCVLLCRYCHQKRTAIQREKRKFDADNGQTRKQKPKIYKKPKLTTENIIEIHNLYSVHNKTQKEIAKQFKVARQQISLILLKKTYKYVDVNVAYKGLQNTARFKQNDESIVTSLVLKPKLAGHPLFPQSKIHPNILDELIEEYQIYEQTHNHSLTLEKIAQKFHLSRSVVLRCFRKCRELKLEP